MTHWDGIEEFIKVVDCRGFTAASENLGLSKSVISRRVSQLEKKLGVKLLQRSTRWQKLTSPGSHFYQRCRRMSDIYNRTENLVLDMQDNAKGTLKLAISNIYGVHYVATAIAEFSTLHRELEVDVTTRQQAVDIIAEGYDIAIRYGELEDSSLIARRFASVTFCLCASPEYFAQEGKPSTVADLQGHNCLIGRRPFWEFNDGRNTKKVKVSGNWHSEDGGTLKAAAMSGIGISQLPLVYVEEELRAGTLVALDDEWTYFDLDAYAVYAHHRPLPKKIRYFVDHLISKYSGEPVRIPDLLDNNQF